MLKTLKRVRNYKLTILLLVAACVVVIYSHFTARLASPSPIFGTLFEGLPGDLPSYSSRFLLSLLLLGLIPLATVLLLGESVKGLGFRFPASPFRPRLFFLLAGAAVLAGYASSTLPEISGFYPYSKTMVTIFRDEGIKVLFLHGALYFLFYYVPWEFFFRGFLILPFLKAVQPDRDISSPISPVLLAVASFQIIPSALLHFGHPVSESLGAVVFGFCAGWFVVKTRSIWPGLVFHAAAGISIDIFLFLKAV
jgi:membrane protease YdiL (CAAX protease family)